jgi:hypothetical protein
MVIATVVDEKSRPIDAASLEMFACYEMIIIVKVHYATALKMAILNFSLVQCVPILYFLNTIHPFLMVIANHPRFF